MSAQKRSGVGIAQEATKMSVAGRLPQTTDTWLAERGNAPPRANWVANQQMLNYRLRTLRRAALGPWVIGVWLIALLLMLWRTL